jgi:AbrB family looped-hinge helix DNA binding protein
MSRTVANARGQVTIPAELRKRLGIKPGTRVTWFEEKGRLILAPMTARRLKEIRGFLKPRHGKPSSKAAQYDAAFKRKMTKAEKIMQRYPKTLSALAK